MSASSATPLLGRAVALFGNFLLVILAYYQVKTASRSLLLEYGGADAFPYVWVLSAFALLAFISVYNRLIAQVSRQRVVIGSLLAFALLLGAFRVAMNGAGIGVVIAFYVFVDLFSVVLVEQFWSLANSVTREDEGHRSYWFIASGGLVGGVLGGLVAGWLVTATPLKTPDLLLSCAALLLLAAGANFTMARLGLLPEVEREQPMPLSGEGLRAVVANRYLALIALIVCLSQLAEPVVEYQFLRAIDAAFDDTDARSAYLGNFFAVLGTVAIAINLLLTPLVHRALGAIAGLAAQPLAIIAATGGFMAVGGLGAGAVMKIADRGLSYSINRASKELLFMPVPPLLIYQAKAWIDMLGYRMFKVLGSAMIVVFASASPAHRLATDLGWLTFAICAAWLAAVFVLGRERVRLRAAALVTP